ncbi:MAG: zinc metallopeptidase [Chloroflexi bacterium]|nr:zinc metallopeptidase [Chloroflexota bacterium]
MFYNSTYLLCMGPAFLLMMLAQWYVSSTYNRWSRVPLRVGMTGAEVVEYLARQAGLMIRIEPVEGLLTDHYDPRSKTLRLSRKNYFGRSVAAAAVAAHEFGHALQDASQYRPLVLRSAMVPVVNFGSYLGWIFLMAGLFFRLTSLAWLGVLFFAGGAAFALVTLPVEFDASARAKRLLEQTGILRSETEKQGVSKVLTAAALTYVAAFAVALSQLLYYVLLVLGMTSRRR